MQNVAPSKGQSISGYAWEWNDFFVPYLVRFIQNHKCKVLKKSLVLERSQVKCQQQHPWKDTVQTQQT